MGKISTAGVLRLRATNAVSRDKSVRRFAQDDDSVGVLTKNTVNQTSHADYLDDSNGRTELISGVLTKTLQIRTSSVCIGPVTTARPGSVNIFTSLRTPNCERYIPGSTEKQVCGRIRRSS